MSGLEIILPIASSVAIILMVRRQMRRRKEIRRMEKILDNNGIHYQPSTMYRGRKGWRNFFKRKERTYCKIDEVQIIGEENAVNWDEYNR